MLEKWLSQFLPKRYRNKLSYLKLSYYLGSSRILLSPGFLLLLVGCWTYQLMKASCLLGKFIDESPVIWGLTQKRLSLFDFLGTGHVFTFWTFSGLAEIPFADKTWPRKSTLVSKNWHFLGLIFKLNCLSLLNTSSIQSNIPFIVGAKMQLSSRYSNRVTNCWSPKHCSIKWQKLEPAFKSPNHIWVNS